MAGTMMQVARALTVKTLKDIAKKHEKSVAQILLKWAVQKNAVVIPGTGNPKHMAENLNLYSFQLSEHEMTSIDNLSSDPMAKEFFFVPEDES